MEQRTRDELREAQTHLKIAARSTLIAVRSVVEFALNKLDGDDGKGRADAEAARSDADDARGETQSEGAGADASRGDAP
jgi:hypothetical protein